LTDATATPSLATITIGGSGAFALDGVAGTALTTVTVTDTGAVTLFDQTTFSNPAAIVTATANQTSSLTIGSAAHQMSGAGDTVTIGSGSHVNGVSSNLWVSGSGDTITIDGTNVNNITASGATNAITVGDAVMGIGGDTVHATGTGETVTLVGSNLDANVQVTVGNGSTVNFNTTGLANGNVFTETVTITGDVTGGTSASFLQTTINHAADNASEVLVFGNASANEVLAGQAVGLQTALQSSLVNVASVTTLPAALDLAASQAALAFNPNPNTTTFGQIAQNTGVIDWFQFGGNTYIVEAVNSSNVATAHTALGAHDAVVELTGLVNIGANGSFINGHLTL
jgi:hypothetical protein